MWYMLKSSFGNKVETLMMQGLKEKLHVHLSDYPEFCSV